MKTPTQRFIEDAIAGGWKGLSEFTHWELGNNGKTLICGVNTLYKISIEEILLKPSAWEAVGRQRGWPEHPDYLSYKMSEFIIKIADGKTIDEALKAIE